MTPPGCGSAGSFLGGEGVQLVGQGVEAFGPAGLVAVNVMGLLLPQVLYLWMFTGGLDGLIPNSVPDWMLPRGTLLYYQYALVMPALLHGAIDARANVWPLVPPNNANSTMLDSNPAHAKAVQESSNAIPA